MNRLEDSSSSISTSNSETAVHYRLNLPSYPHRVRRQKERLQIFDILRHRFVALTPEEWVRQHFIHYLITSLSYPIALMGNEISLKLNGMSRRCDTLVCDRQLRPCMIIEYKRPDVSITQCVFDQICRYNMVMHVNYLVVSNGINHYCCKMDYKNNSYHFLPNLPTYEECIATLDDNAENAATNNPQQ